MKGRMKRSSKFCGWCGNASWRRFHRPYGYFCSAVCAGRWRENQKFEYYEREIIMEELGGTTDEDVWDMFCAERGRKFPCHLQGVQGNGRIVAINSSQWTEIKQ